MRYGFGGAQSATTETNRPVDPKGDAMPPTPETPRDPQAFLQNFFGPPLTFEQQRTLAKDDEARAVRELARLEAFRAREGKMAFDLGLKSNLFAAFLKDVPRALQEPANRYNDAIRGVLDIQRLQQPLLTARQGVQDFSSSFRTRA